MASCSSGSSNNNWTDAYYYSEQSVKGQLKLPNTAEFPGIGEQEMHTNEISEGIFLVDSWVESENGFGGTVRKNFEVRVEFNGEKASTKLDWKD